MNKTELIKAMMEKTGDTKKTTEETLNAFISVITEALQNEDKVQLLLQYSKLEKL